MDNNIEYEKNLLNKTVGEILNECYALEILFESLLEALITVMNSCPRGQTNEDLRKLYNNFRTSFDELTDNALEVIDPLLSELSAINKELKAAKRDVCKDKVFVDHAKENSISTPSFVDNCDYLHVIKSSLEVIGDQGGDD